MESNWSMCFRRSLRTAFQHVGIVAMLGSFSIAQQSSPSPFVYGSKSHFTVAAKSDKSRLQLLFASFPLDHERVFVC